MEFYPFYILLLGVSTLVAFALISRLWAIRAQQAAYLLMGTILCVAIWAFVTILEIVVPNLATKIICAKAEYVAIPFISPLLFLFVLSFTGKDQWVRGIRPLLFGLVPLATFVMALTNESHHLLWTGAGLTNGRAFGPVSMMHGVWFTIHMLYSYTFLIAATALLGHTAIWGKSVYRWQAVHMLAGVAVPWAANIITLQNIPPLAGLDLTPLAFAITVTTISVGFARFKFVDLMPVAQSKVLDSLADGVIVVDPRERMVELNASAERMFDSQTQEVAGREVATMIPRWKEWMRLPSETEIELTRPGRSGDRVLSVRITDIPGARGRSSGKIVSVIDVTEKKAAAAQIRLQAAAMEAVENGIVITDPRGTIQWCNPGFSRLTGFTREEAIGQNPRILKSGRNTREMYREMWGTLVSGRVWRGELYNRRKDGREYYEEMAITPLVLGDGTITNFIAITRDVSERRRAEEELRRAHRESLEANRLKTQLLASVSHDLRNPLSGILGYADMLHSGTLGVLSPEQASASAEILECSERLLSFVNNLIGQAQIETGRVVLNPTPFSPSELVAGVVDMTRYLAAKKGLAVQTFVDPALPRSIAGDPYWLRQILLNLVTNALKFTDAGKVTVGASAEGADAWVMVVEDTGCGISPQDQARVFEAFRKVGNAPSSGGSGLGLAIVSQLAALMGGTVSLWSGLGLGSTFTVRLPLREIPPAQ